MPKNEHLKGVIALAVRRAESIMPTYPTHFHSIEDAKKCIATHCENADFVYSPKMTLSYEYEAEVRDKVHYFVAVHAFEQGEFYLEVPLVDRAQLRAAIETDINRILALITSWPLRFVGVENAKNFVASVVNSEQFQYTEFGGVEKSKFESYVKYNTVRHAFEAGEFGMQCPGKGWVVKRGKGGQLPSVTSEYATLKETVEADIHRLLPQILSWPPLFPSLNAARDFVQHFCHDFHFKYTSHPDVKMQYFRLYVNFNAAKHAFQAGKFTLEEQPDAAALGRTMKTIRGRETEKKRSGLGQEEGSVDSEDTVVESGGKRRKVETALDGMRSASSLKQSLPVAEKSGNTNPSTFSTATAKLIDDIRPRSTTSINTALNPFEQLEERLSRIEEKVEEIEAKPELKKDPFKDLLAELSRASILKAAFD